MGRFFLYLKTRLLVIIVIMVSMASPHALAQVAPGLSEKQKETISEIIEKIEIYEAQKLAEHTAHAHDKHPQTLIQLRRAAQTAISEPNPETARLLTERFKVAAYEAGSERDKKIAEIFETYLPIAENYGNTDIAKSTLADLEPFRNDTDWVIRHRAKIFSMIADIFQQNMSQALTRTNESLQIIPMKDNIWVDEAKVLSLDRSAFLYNATINPAAAIDATLALIDLSLQTDHHIDSASLLANLIYSVNRWREFDTTIILAQSLKEVSKTGSTFAQTVSNLRLANAYNAVGRYEEAIDVLGDVGDSNDRIRIQQSYFSAMALAKAGMGDVEAARNFQKRLYASFAKDEAPSLAFEVRRLETEALIAKAQGDDERAAQLLHSAYKMDIQSILQTNSSETQKLAATMQDSKARLAEREAAYSRELALTNATIESQQNNIVYAGLAAFFAIAVAIGALLVGLWRKRTNIRLLKAANDAEAGNKAKSEFLAVMSHELRTPLNGIIGIADVISKTAETVDLKQKNDLILQSGLSLLDQLDGILDMSKMEAGRMDLCITPTRIHDIVETLITFWGTKAQENSIALTHFIAPDVPGALDLDPKRVKQCLNNLISNAIKFTHNGRVHVHVTAEPQDGTDLCLKIIVADTGAGISETVQARLFSPFTQADATISRRYGGSGLGLSITRALSRLMKGDVTVTSTEGRGSEFTLTVKTQVSTTAVVPMPISTQRALPAVQIPSAAPEPVKDSLSILVPGIETLDVLPASPPPPPPITPEPSQADVDPDNLNGLNVLVVEDIVSNQEVMKIFLEPVGCNVTCANHGIQALKIMETKIFDVILMDIRMPEMDGIETTHHIRSAEGPHRDVPIIALTADASTGNNAQCMAAGADVFLTKPIIVTELLGAMRFVRRQKLKRGSSANTAARTNTLGLPQAQNLSASA